MQVVELDKIIDVPESYIECSVCGKFYPHFHFKHPTDKGQTRTNCYACYNMPMEEMEQLGKQTDKFKQENAYRILELKEEIQTNKEYESYSISVKDLISKLSKLPDTAKVVITQSGYYSQCALSEIYDTPDKIKDINGIPYYSIGHSSH